MPLSTYEYKWVSENCQGNVTKCWEVTCDGLASHPEGVAILLVALWYGNRDKPDGNGPPGSFGNPTNQLTAQSDFPYLFLLAPAFKIRTQKSLINVKTTQ